MAPMVPITPLLPGRPWYPLWSPTASPLEPASLGISMVSGHRSQQGEAVEITPQLCRDLLSGGFLHDLCSPLTCCGSSASHMSPFCRETPC